MAILVIVSLIAGLLAALRLGYLVGQRLERGRPGVVRIDFNLFSDALSDVSGVIGEIVSAFQIPHFILDPHWDGTKRRMNEHPFRWVQRVGKRSGYCIREGEEWRYEASLRDWWTPDDVSDEYGRWYPHHPDLWSGNRPD